MSELQRLEKEYIIFCDESVKNGRYYSNFYGGVIVGASRYENVTERLNARKLELGFHGEVKWNKVTENYLAKYQELIRGFFEEVREGNIRLRLMFRQNAARPMNLTEEHIGSTYFLLYYQFIKHAFGIRYAPVHPEGLRLRLYFDEFPNTKEEIAQFKGFLLGLPQNSHFRHGGLYIEPEDITEVRSHDHVLLQCLDLVLGAMQFRLNDLHREKPEGALIRGKRTRAKAKLYKSIRTEICKLRPNFNIGVSTACTENERWEMPYRHWLFCASDSEFDSNLTKRKREIR